MAYEPEIEEYEKELFLISVGMVQSMTDLECPLTKEELEAIRSKIGEQVGGLIADCVRAVNLQETIN